MLCGGGGALRGAGCAVPYSRVLPSASYLAPDWDGKVRKNLRQVGTLVVRGGGASQEIFCSVWTIEQGKLGDF